MGLPHNLSKLNLSSYTYKNVIGKQPRKTTLYHEFRNIKIIQYNECKFHVNSCELAGTQIYKNKINLSAYLVILCTTSKLLGPVNEEGKKKKKMNLIRYIYNLL